jgi:uncharacterized membrane protein
MWLLFIELLIPWLVMGGAAVLAAEAGLPDWAIIVLALSAAVGVTFLIREFEKRRRRGAPI